MSEKYNQTMSSLLFLPGANSWYIEGDLDVPVLPPKKKSVFPTVPNNKPILPSGEIANKNQPPENPNQENGIEEEDDVDYETPDEEDMEFEDDMDQNGHEISQTPIIRLDSCGREVEEFCELITSDDETELEADESSSAQPSDNEENIQPASPITTRPSPDNKPASRVMTRRSSNNISASTVMTRHSSNNKPAATVMTPSSNNKPAATVKTRSSSNKSQAVKTQQNGHSKDASTSTSPEIIHHQYWPVKNSPPKTMNQRQTTTKRKKFITTDVQIDHFNGMMKYTFIKKPVDASSDEEESASVRNFSQKVSSSNDFDELSDSFLDSEDDRIIEQIDGGAIDGNPWLSFQEINLDHEYSSDEEELFPNKESMVIKEKDNKFIIYIKCEDFKPEEVAVYIEDNLLQVEGKKVCESPNSFLHSSTFNWEFKIPEEVDIDSVNSFDILPDKLKIVCPKIITTTIMD